MLTSQMKTPWQERVPVRLAVITLSSFLYALNLKSFVAAGDLFPGGFAGLSRLIQRAAAVYLDLTVPFAPLNLLFNAIPAIISFKLIGKKFTLYSCLAIVLTSFFTDLIPTIEITEDVLLVCVFGGLLNGLGLGIIYRAGVTTGGVDIVVKFLRIKYQYLNFGTLMLILDVAILAVYALIFNTLEAAMYSTIAMFVVSRAIDVVLYGLSASKVCYIISDESDKLKNTITHQLGRGVTLLHGEGAYTGKAKNVILCVIKKTQITQVRRIVKTVDVHAFLIVTDARDVFGNGFENIESEN